MGRAGRTQSGLADRPGPVGEGISSQGLRDGGALVRVRDQHTTLVAWRGRTVRKV
jgi:hypothetical protein